MLRSAPLPLPSDSPCARLSLTLSFSLSLSLCSAVSSAQLVDGLLAPRVEGCWSWSPLPSSSSWLLVCCHALRDERCGLRGPPLLTALNAALDDRSAARKDGSGRRASEGGEDSSVGVAVAVAERGSDSGSHSDLGGDDVALLECSHLNGHKYAAICVAIDAASLRPHWWGYVRPEDAPLLIDMHSTKSGHAVANRPRRGGSHGTRDDMTCYRPISHFYALLISRAAFSQARNQLAVNCTLLCSRLGMSTPHQRRCCTSPSLQQPLCALVLWSFVTCPRAGGRLRESGSASVAAASSAVVVVFVTAARAVRGRCKRAAGPCAWPPGCR